MPRTVNNKKRMKRRIPYHLSFYKTKKIIHWNSLDNFQVDQEKFSSLKETHSFIDSLFKSKRRRSR